MSARDLIWGPVPGYFFAACYAGVAIWAIVLHDWSGLLVTLACLAILIFRSSLLVPRSLRSLLVTTLVILALVAGVLFFGSPGVFIAVALTALFIALLLWVVILAAASFSDILS